MLKTKIRSIFLSKFDTFTCQSVTIFFVSTVTCNCFKQNKICVCVHSWNELSFLKLFQVQSCFSFAANENFLKKDIRVKPGLDGLGALGDAGWYTIQASLLANSFRLPKTVTALPGHVLNDAGIVLSCGALLDWEEGVTATIYCSFLANVTMEITAIGTKRTLRVHDFVIPFQETEASFTTSTTDCLSEHKTMNEIPQEACMVIEFARLVGEIKNRGAKPDGFWLSFSRKTQVIVDAVKESLHNNLERVLVSGR